MTRTKPSLFTCVALVPLLGSTGCGVGPDSNPDEDAAIDAESADAARFDATGSSDAAPPLPNTGSLAFDGTDDRVQVPGAESLRNFTALTIEAWAKPTGDVAGESAILGKTYDGSNWELGLFRRPDGAAELDWSCGGFCGYFLTSGTNAFPVDQWTHIAGTWSPAGATLYVNGNQVATGAGGVSGLANTLNVLLIGAAELNGTPARFWRGGLDEIRIWNVVRTQAQIQANMRSTLVGDESGLVAYWNAEQGSGNVLSDATSNGNHGRLGASPDVDAADPAWSADVP